MATAPTFVTELETAWNSSTTPKTTGSVTGLTGDVIVAYAVRAGWSSGDSITISNSGSALTWNLEQAVTVTDYCEVRIWTTVLGGNQDFTVSFARVGDNHFYGGGVQQFRDSDGVGTGDTKTNVLSGAPSLAVTTGADNSAIVVVVGDWNAADGASRTWRTVNSITPTAGNNLERTYFRDSSQYSLYAGYYSDAGAAGAKTVGLSAPGSQKYSIVAVEVKGTAGGGGGTTPKGVLGKVLTGPFGGVI